MSKPTTDLEWASSDVDEGVSGGDNKVEPTVGYKTSGVLYNEPLIRPYLNYVLNLISQWVTYLNGGVVGDIKILPSAETVATVGTRYGGTWVSEGTDTVAGYSVEVFRRTV